MHELIWVLIYCFPGTSQERLGSNLHSDINTNSSIVSFGDLTPQALQDIKNC